MKQNKIDLFCAWPNGSYWIFAVAVGLPVPLFRFMQKCWFLSNILLHFGRVPRKKTPVCTLFQQTTGDFLFVPFRILNETALVKALVMMKQLGNDNGS